MSIVADFMENVAAQNYDQELPEQLLALCQHFRSRIEHCETGGFIAVPTLGLADHSAQFEGGNTCGIFMPSDWQHKDGRIRFVDTCSHLNPDGWRELCTFFRRTATDGEE